MGTLMGAKIIGSGKCRTCENFWAVLDSNLMRRHRGRKIEDMNPDGSCKGSGEEPTAFIPKGE